MNSTIDLKTLNLIAGDAYAGDVSNDMRKQASLPTNVMGKDCWCSGELLGQRKMTRIEHRPEGAVSVIEHADGGTIFYDDQVSTNGRMILTTLDPCYHHGSYFMPSTTEFLKGFLPWLKA